MVKTTNKEREIILNWINGNRKDAINEANKLSPAGFGLLVLIWTETYSSIRAGDGLNKKEIKHDLYSFVQRCIDAESDPR